MINDIPRDIRIHTDEFFIRCAHSHSRLVIFRADDDMPRLNFVENTHGFRRPTRGERRGGENKGGHCGYDRAHARVALERVAWASAPSEIGNKLADMTAGEVHSCHSSRPFLMTEDLGEEIFGPVRLGIRKE